MIFIDSSIWIDYLNRFSRFDTQIDSFLDTQEAIAVTGIVEQEVLQGIRSETKASKIQEIFDNMIYFAMDLESTEFSLLQQAIFS